MKLSLAVALLIAPTQTTKLTSKSATRVGFPTIPVSGAEVVGALIPALQEVNIEQLMDDPRKECVSDWDPNIVPGSDQDKCWDYNRGLKREIERANEDMGEAMSEMGVEPSTQGYDAKFVTDLIAAEYNAFVKALVDHQDDAAGEVDKLFGEITTTLTEAGLAQIDSKSKQDMMAMAEPHGPQCPAPAEADCWQQWDCEERKRGNVEWPGPDTSREEQDAFYMNMRKERKTFMTTCYTQKSAAAAQVAEALGSFDDVRDKLNMAITMGLTVIQSGEPLTQLTAKLTDLNNMLSHEAERLGVEGAGSLPVPAALASDIVALVTNAANFALNEPRGQQGVEYAAMDIVADTVQEVARAERDFNELKNLPDQAFDHISQEISGEVGIQVSSADLKGLRDAVVSEVEAVWNDPSKLDGAFQQAQQLL